MEEPLIAAQNPTTRGRYIKKRALKNKSLTVSFDEKDLKDFVTGFHKRKKKRRKEAQAQLEESLRKKRIEARKKRKEEREFAIFGGAAPDSAAVTDEPDEDLDDEEENEPNATVSVDVSFALRPSISEYLRRLSSSNFPELGSSTYDNGDVQVVVTTSEISREEEVPPQSAIVQHAGETKHNKRIIPINKKKSFKKVAKKRSRSKPQSKRDKRKGKMKNKKHHQ